MNQPPQPSSSGSSQQPDTLDFMFREYHLLMEGTDKITDRRQTVNTLFVSINALFLTGVGYMLMQSLKDLTSVTNSLLYIVGFLIIAFIATSINHRWLKLSGQYSNLVNLRIRYLTAMEEYLRSHGAFPQITIPLRKDEYAPNTPATKTSRGTYSFEEVIYVPAVTKKTLSFTDSEKQISHLFTASYWIVVTFALVGVFTLEILPKLIAGQSLLKIFNL